MTYGSVCSGIESATTAWHPLGWKPAWFAEIEPFASAVLATRWPEVENVGDFTTISDSTIDLLAGGTPCQSFSVAGQRAGLDDPRGVLAFEFIRLAQRLRPRWIVFENVPGLLSSNKGRDFGAFLQALADSGYGFAYRVLDAQYFGLAQRRKRVFVVGYLGDWRPPAAVLFEPESLSGNPKTSRPPEKEVAALSASGVGTCGADDNQAQAGHLIPFDTTQITSAVNRSNPKPGDPCHPISSTGHPPTIAFNLRGRSEGSQPEPADKASIRASNGGSSRTYVCAPLAQTLSASWHKSNGAVAGNNSGMINPIISNVGVRRLTPRECERLQGFPDDYTLITYKNKPASDSNRYRVLGNAMAVPVMRWIGQRIQEMENILDS